jgi:alpha-mannosidase
MSLSYWFLPHTHWDREWYLSYQDFRWKLVAAIDAILDTLHEDADFAHFMLDGQTIVLEDYLELRPARRQELQDLVAAGRLAVGPWYVQPDDILVSGEALVRNLERGLRVAGDFGGGMPVGYLPDSFGHCAGLPTILQGFGIKSTALMRGPGPELDKVLFRWSARDGSAVLAAHLVDSYGNGADLVMEPAALSDGLSTLVERQKESMLPGVPLLVMNGMDHRSISAGLPRALAQAGLRDRARIGSLPQYIELAEKEVRDIPEWNGELRSCWRFTITAGCTSTRQWIKREDQAVSALLEREAEPLSALASLLGAPYPEAAIDLAWKHLLQNQPHDSVCGCSIDAVHEDMRYRYAQARGLGENVVRQAGAYLASQADSSFARPGETVAVALNPGPSRVAALLSFPAGRLPPDPVLVDREGRPHAVQLLSAEGGSAVFFDERFTPRQLTFAMGMVKHGKFLELSVVDAKASWEDPSVLRIDLELVERGHSEFNWDAWARETLPLLEAPGLSQVHAVGLRSGNRTALFMADLPSFGARSFAIREAGSAGAASPFLSAGRRGLSNTRFSVRIRRDGSLDVTDRKLGIRLRGVNRIVDGGDRGDEYNYDGPPADTTVTAPSVRVPRMRRVRTEVIESGPVRATVRIRGTYRLPVSVASDRRSRGRRKASVEVVRCVSLLAEGDRIDFRTEIDNQARDHRMRVHFPLPGQTRESLAGGTFGSVQRPARPPAAPPGLQRPFFPELGQEEPAATHPFTGFVACAAGACTVAALARGIREYEVLESGREIALTLFRSVGWLSRADLASRKGNAGPDTPTPAAQEIGKHVFEYALYLHAGAPDESLLSREWEDFRSSPRAVLRSAGPGSLGDGSSLLDVQDEKLIFSSLRRTGHGAFSLRLFDTGGSVRTAVLRFSRPVAWASKARMDGAPICPLSIQRDDGGSFALVTVRPWEAITIEFGGTE